MKYGNKSPDVATAGIPSARVPACPAKLSDANSTTAIVPMAGRRARPVSGARLTPKDEGSEQCDTYGC